MAVNIGPRIGVEGEAQYKSQISQIISTTKALKSEMKETESAFKNGGSAMQKNLQKAKNLSQQIDLQKQKVELLKGQLAQAAQKYGEDSTQALKYRDALAKANTELNNMESEMGGLSPTMKAFSDTMAESGQKLQEIGGKMSEVGTTLTTHVTAPILAVGGVSVAAFNDVDKGLDTIVKKTSATGETMDGLRDSMEQLATTIPTGFEEAGEAVGEVNTRFGLTGDELTDLSGQFLKFAQLNGTDVSGSIDKAQSAMAAFNLDSSEAGNVLDILNKAGQDTGVSMDKLSSDLTANSTTLKEMGFDLNQSAGFMANLNKNGIDSSAAMTGLKKALQSATKEGKPLDEALAELQDNLANAESSTDAMALATEIFGAKAGPQLAAAISEGRLSLDASANAIEDFGGSVSQTFDNTLNAPDKLTTTLNELKLVGADLASVMMEMAVPAIQKVTDFVKKAKGKWDGLDKSQKESIVRIAGIAAAIGPVLTVGGKLVSGIGTAMTWAPKIISAATTIGAALTGTVIPAIVSVAAAIGPLILAVGAGIAIGVAAGIAIVKNWDKIKEAAKKLWDNIKKMVQGVAQAFSNLKNAAVNTVTTMINSIKAKFTALKTSVTTTATNIRTAVVDKFNALKTSVTTTATNIRTAVVDKFNALKTGVITVAGKIRSAVVDKFGAIKTAITDKINAAKDAVRNAIDKIKSFFDFSWSLPKIKLPHFSISGQFSLDPPSIPQFSVDWYKRAYNNPVMFTRPTVVGNKGFGDGSGGEIVIGQRTFTAWIRDAVADVGGSSAAYHYGDINVVVNSAQGQDVRELADLVADRIQQKVSMRRRGM